MRKSIIAQLSLMLFLASAVTALAQLGGTPEQQIITPAAEAAESSGAGGLSNTIMSPCGQANLLLEVKNACSIAQIAIIEAAAEREVAEGKLAVQARRDAVTLAQRQGAHLAAALDDQAWRSAIIFWVAMGIVGLGVLAAGMQFRVGWRNIDGPATEFSVSQKQLTIKTTWIGVVLLAMSMVFFTLYLTLVYQIEAI